MANEIKKVEEAVVNHVINGSAVAASGGFMPTTDVNLTVANANNKPFARLKLTITFAVATTGGERIYVLRRDSGAPVPDSVYPFQMVGSFVVDTDTAHVLEIPAVPLNGACDFILQNETGQVFPTTWDLDVYVWTYGVA